MYPTRQKAVELLYDAEKSNPGPWVRHSLAVAECAEKIAAACGLDSQKAYVVGLLHDIGRKFGTSHFGHVVDGYWYMDSLNYDEAARVCLTHSFSIQCMEDYIGKIDVSPRDAAEFKEKLAEVVFDDYDRLIQLCDSLVGTEIVNMEDRMNDVERRYGSYPQKKRAANLELKAYFEQLAGDNIYRIVTDNQELWGL